MKKYSGDELGGEIPKSLTFMDVYMGLINHVGVYGMLGKAADSIVRERIFQALADSLGAPYEWVYDMWMDCITW